ncbi:hypothetical protein ACFL1H_00200 [Nanoarchaeota archaeon]
MNKKGFDITWKWVVAIILFLIVLALLLFIALGGKVKLDEILGQIGRLFGVGR